LIYLFITLFLMMKFIKKFKFGKSDIALFVLLIFGILTFNQARIRTDPAHLLTVIYPSVILFGFMLYKIIYFRKRSKFIRYSYNTYVIIIFFLFSLLVIKNIDKFIKNVFKKPYKKSILLAKFDRGAVYIPKEEKDDVVNTVAFLKDHTKSGERIYVGNTAHWKDDFGGSVILYTLCHRMPSTKYYEIHPGFITQKNIQEEMKNSLQVKNVRYLVLQDIDATIAENIRIDDSALILDDYIKRAYTLVKKYGKYNIYGKRLQRLNNGLQ